MALINIEYGSLASSETMNKNFSYLDNKIAESSESIMTSISSILSNIATINSRLNDLSEGVDDSVEELNLKLEDYKTKTKLLVSKASMLPNWAACEVLDVSSVNSGDEFTINKNGYLLIAPKSTSEGVLSINSVPVNFRTTTNSYDYSSQLVAIPLKAGDKISCTFIIKEAYFLPTGETSVEDF